jgi:Ca-activated chloride channel family protein
VSDLHFADSGLLWLLLLVYLGWLALWWFLARRRTAAAVRFSTTRTLERLRPSRTLVQRRLVQGLRLLTVALLVLGMARPQTGRRQTQVRTEGIDIILVLDTSGSMQALDLDADRAVNRRRNRLEMARSVVEQFIQKRQNDQIGMVVFGNEAFTQCPLTLDHGVVASFLERVEIGMAGDGTAIGSALGTAVKRLRDSEAVSKVIILLTDGRNNAGALSPRKAAEIAETFSTKVYTIGVGTRGKAPFIVDSLFGKRVVYEDVEIDEEMLREISSRTGGAYFRAEDGEALAEIYNEIDRLETSEITTESYMEYDERYRGLVLPALGLLLLETLLLGTRFRKLP